jgi:hypothetical protein
MKTCYIEEPNGTMVGGFSSISAARQFNDSFFNGVCVIRDWDTEEVVS